MNERVKKVLNILKKIVINNKIFGACTLLSFIVAIIFNCYNIYNGTIIIIFLYWIYSVIYCITDLKRNSLILIMLLCFFTFIISRPLISLFRGDEWWYFSDVAISKALISIFLSLAFIMIGNKIYLHILYKRNDNKINFKKTNINRRKIIKAKKVLVNRHFESKIIFVIFCFVIITGVFCLYMEVSNYISLHGIDYSKVYTAAVPNHNIIVRVMSSLYIYIFILYLVTMPKKKYVYILLMFFIITSVPSFLLGSRNVLVLRVIFSLLYVFFRNYTRYYDEVWITKKIKIALMVSVPIFVVFMGAYNYIRADENIDSSPMELIVDTFYKQGTTFDTICQGFEYEEKLKDNKKISYSFGDIIDYLVHNTISQKIFSTKAFPSGNSLIVVREGNSLAHKLSYYVLGEFSYLDGHGRGTSYILETYMDGSYLWLSLYSILLGVYLTIFFDLINKNKVLLSFIVLMSIYEIFLLPRFSASGFISFVIKPQFWAVYLLFYYGNIIYLKEFNYEKK